ncbi:LytR/AlgR family response regulator transcription factor [Aquimarina sp. 2201CG14-23]|uniref:LytR/AlgR family response regulator transcription factor n=1 Tax=Aquimarina mycalae TaxID=3040073 RepID=UPI0024781FEB|nr:LytTR family DNA-binding domain-containing protein [Aquimarina sp. 2201CG14-23]MDH7444533.1 LytTR family DNA-binding domain-containing protein [Aquimarina sp. 2201CG14-23]
MIIKSIIIDDEYLAVSIIESYLEEFKNIEIVGVYKNPIEALPILEEGEIDVVFLDINMPRMNGIEFLKSLQKYPQIIITTAYKEYAIESYELEVLDYLVKPIPFSRFLKSINKLMARFTSLEKLKSSTEFAQAPHIFLKVDRKLVKVFLNDILYIESLRDYIKVCSIEGNYVSHKSLTSITEELPEENFIRVHKSYTIAIDKVKSIEGNQIEIENKRIPIGRNYTIHAKQKILKNKGNLLKE